MVEHKPGTIIVLYGIPCSGKTTIALALQEVADKPIFLLGLDAWAEHIMPPKFYFGTDQDKGFSSYMVDDELRVKFGPVAQQTMSAFHHTIENLARQGHSVVLDHIFYDDCWLHECKKLWKDLPIIWVKLTIPLEKVLQRESKRKKLGEYTKEHLNYCIRTLHKNAPVDLLIDTSQISAQEAAKNIYDKIN